MIEHRRDTIYQRLSGPSYRLVEPDNAPATESQIAWLRLRGVSVPTTRREASRMIDALVNRS